MHGSRVVRATLAKHLKGEFEILEEGDGESAWQTLMLDANIDAVVSGVHTPKLEAHDLLARLRVSSMRRLRSIPFVLIVSDFENEAEREFDRTCGVAGFITKSMKQAAIVNHLRSLLGGAVAEPSDLPDAGEAMLVEIVEPTPPPLTAEVLQLSSEPVEADSEPPLAATPAAPASPPSARFDSEKLLPNDRFNEVLAAISFTGPDVADVCALVFAIDKQAQLIESFGEDVAQVIAERFATLLLAKVGPKDSIGRWQGDQLAIVSHGVDLKQGVNFAHRVCKSLATGQISIRGKKVRLTASVGVASSSDDCVGNGDELFVLAARRLEQALVCGGNTVSAEFKAACPLHGSDRLAETLVNALTAQGRQGMAASIGTLGLKLLPLLQVMDKELALDLPLARIARQLKERANIEGAAG